MKTALEVVEEIFTAAFADPSTAQLTTELQSLWKGNEWSDETIVATLAVYGEEQ